MSGIQPTLPPVPAPAPPPAVVTAVPVSEVPPEIAALPANTVIDATVATATANVAAAAAATAQARAVVQLLTSLGNLTVRLPLPIPPDATLKLQVVGAGANLQLRVIAINGQPLQTGLAPNLGEAPTPASLAGSLAAGARATAGSPVSVAPQPGVSQAAGGAVDLLSPSALRPGGIAATVVFGTQPGLPTGTQLIVRLLGIEPPLAGNATLGASPEASLHGTAGPAGPIGTTAGTTTTAPGASIGIDAKAQGEPVKLGGVVVAPATGGTPSAPGASVVGSASPSTGLAASPSGVTTNAGLGLPSNPLTGTVAPNSLGGKPLIQTALGLISLETAPDLAPGARVVFETVGNPVPPPAVPTTAPVVASSVAAGQPATGWAAFGDAVAVLQKADPEVAQMLVQRLPDLGPQFMANAAGWVAAAQTGDMRAWLGDRAVKALEKSGRGDLIERLEGDMGEMRANVTLPRGAGDWQVVTLPLFFGQSVERIRLTMRRARGDEDEEGREEEGLRFLVDVDMSRLGALQFDGLVKRNAKSFDLIVRSRRALPDDVRREIGVIFARALDSMGMIGGAVFKQAVAFIEPLPVRSGTGLTI